MLHYASTSQTDIVHLQFLHGYLSVCAVFAMFYITNE